MASDEQRLGTDLDVTINSLGLICLLVPRRRIRECAVAGWVDEARRGGLVEGRVS